MKVSAFSALDHQSVITAEDGLLVSVVDFGSLDRLKTLLQSSHMKEQLNSEMGIAAFMRAACLNRVDMMELLSPIYGLKLDARNKVGETALVQAAKHGSHAAMAWLIKAGADVNIMDDSGSIAFFEYVNSPMPEGELAHEILRLFLDNHLDLDATDAGGRTPLMLLAQKKGLAKYICLANILDMGARKAGSAIEAEKAIKVQKSINAVDREGCTALHYAVGSGDHDFCQSLVKYGAKLSTVANDGRSALDAARDAAVNARDHLFVKYLEDVETFQKNQVLIGAREQRKKLLLEHDQTKNAGDSSDLDDDDDDGRDVVFDLVERQKVFAPARHETDFSEMNHIHTPMLNAAKSGNREYVSGVMKSANVNIDVQDPHGWSPLMCAALSAEKDFLKFFLDELDENKIKFDLNLVNQSNESALMLSARGNLADNMKMLLLRHAGEGLDVNIVARDGCNAFMFYVLHCQEELNADLVQLFLDKKLDVGRKNEALQTATMFFAGTKGKEAKELFLKAQGVLATIDMIDSKDMTALMYAMNNDDHEYFEMLIDAGADINLQVNGYSVRSLAEKFALDKFLKIIDSSAERSRPHAFGDLVRLADGN